MSLCEPGSDQLERTSRMAYRTLDCGTLSASVSASHFQSRSGVDEYHLIVRPVGHGSIDAHLESVLSAYLNALDSLGLDMRTAVLRRFFCSDLPNQVTALEAHPFSNPRNPDQPCAVSWVGQPPIPPVKVALWAYHISDRGHALDTIQEGTSLTVRRGDLSHHWTTGITCLNADTPYDQTRGIFEGYEAFLQSRGLCLADHVIRTWLFVQNIDANYRGMAAARREFFAARGLTPNTHFIASTGVGGACAELAARVTMDACAISGLRPEQIEFLAAPDYLSPTHIYGVTFERGVSVAYHDRKHVIISGTASIDRDGKILHPGDVSRQLERTLENVAALLAQAGAAFEDVCAFIVYVRDPSDFVVAWREMRERFGDAPMEVVVAPVCRPGWLIEVECEAIVSACNPELPAF
jgi:enamine deaminase RidA (YjgF/YER057c/UK114 family)